MVIAVKDVPRWVQPDLQAGTTVGEAIPKVFAVSDAVVVLSATATPVFRGRGSGGAAVDAPARVVLIIDGYPLPRPVAGATVAIETDFTTDDYIAAGAYARIAMLARANAAIAGYANAVFGVLARSTGVKVAVEAKAEISFGDFGMDTAIFPFGFPYQFRDLSNPVGDAVVALNNTGSVDGAGGVAEAKVTLNCSTPLTIKGTVTMFPFRFPGVFDSTATVRLGTAVVDPGRQWFSTAVSVVGLASVPIYGANFALRQTIFPFGFPAVFDSTGYATADASISIVGECSAVVAQDADAVVSISTFVSVDSSAVFPWMFGVIFQ